MSGLRRAVWLGGCLCLRRTFVRWGCFFGAHVCWGACTGHRVLPSAHVPRLRLLLYFAAGRTRCPVHEVSRRGTRADQRRRVWITPMVCSAQRSKGGGRRPGDMSGAEYAVGVIPP